MKTQRRKRIVIGNLLRVSATVFHVCLEKNVWKECNHWVPCSDYIHLIKLSVVLFKSSKFCLYIIEKDVTCFTMMMTLHVSLCSTISF